MPCPVCQHPIGASDHRLCVLELFNSKTITSVDEWEKLSADKREDSEEFEKLSNLFSDDVFEDLLTKALLVGAERVTEDDLWISTPSTMIRRSLLDAVCKDSVLFPEFLGILSEDLGELVARFVNLEMPPDEDLAEDERVAVHELTASYAGDKWLWAKDAFSQTQEFAGSDLDGFQPEDVSDAIIRLLAAAWA